MKNEENYLAWCMKCQKKVNVINPKIEAVRNINGTRNAVKGFCACGTKISVFIKKDEK